MASINTIKSNIKRLLISRSYYLNPAAKHSIWTEEKTVRSPYTDVEIPTRTLVEHVWQNLDKWSDKTAMVCGVTNRSITYHQLYKSSRNFAAQLRSKFNISDGDVIGIIMCNIPEYSAVALGALEAGAVVTTMNPCSTPYEIQQQLYSSNPKLLVGMPASVPNMKDAMKLAKMELPIISCNTNSSIPLGTVSYQELINDNHIDLNVLKHVKRNENDLIILPYSSGTTGMPKGVELTNKNIVANCVQLDVKECRQYQETTSTFQDVYLAVLPFHHIFSMVQIILHKLSVGAQIVTLPKFEPSSLIKVLKDHKISVFDAVSPLVLFLASHPGITGKLLEPIRLLKCGGMPVPKADFESLYSKVKHDLQFLQQYGLTETSPVATAQRLGTMDASSVGLPVANTELKIVNSKLENLGPNEVGEIYIKGPQVMKGYRNNPEETKKTIVEGGWLKTGDQGSIAEDGTLTITGRLKELIKVKGHQVPPAELESVIKQHPDVLEAGVIGIPEKTGERPTAFVVVKEGRKVMSEDICEFVAKRVTEYKRLKDVIFLDSLPKSHFGKLLRKNLKDKYYAFNS